MGMLLDSTPEMGEYFVEVRRESFYIRGERENCPTVYPDRPDTTDGTVEFLLCDIPKIRAALDRVEEYEAERKSHGNR